MATRRSSDERPSSEERRARARAEPAHRHAVEPRFASEEHRSIVLFRNSAVFLCSTLLIRISSVGAGRSKTEELFEGGNPAQRWRGPPAPRRSAVARDDSAPCRISVESFSRHGFAG